MGTMYMYVCMYMYVQINVYSYVKVWGWAKNGEMGWFVGGEGGGEREGVREGGGKRVHRYNTIQCMPTLFSNWLIKLSQTGKTFIRLQTIQRIALNIIVATIAKVPQNTPIFSLIRQFILTTLFQTTFCYKSVKSQL